VTALARPRWGRFLGDFGPGLAGAAVGGAVVAGAPFLRHMHTRPVLATAMADMTMDLTITALEDGAGPTPPLVLTMSSARRPALLWPTLGRMTAAHFR
jgi:hypothetical protein